MSERQVSDELAIAVIELVRDCEDHVGHGWGGEEFHNPWPNDWNSEFQQKQWKEYLDGVKPVIAKVLALLMAEVEEDIVDVILRDRGYSYD